MEHEAPTIDPQSAQIAKERIRQAIKALRLDVRIFGGKSHQEQFECECEPWSDNGDDDTAISLGPSSEDDDKYESFNVRRSSFADMDREAETTAQSLSNHYPEVVSTDDSNGIDGIDETLQADDEEGSFCFHCGSEVCQGMNRISEHSTLMVLGSGSLNIGRDGRYH